MAVSDEDSQQHNKNWSPETPYIEEDALNGEEDYEDKEEEVSTKVPLIQVQMKFLKNGISFQWLLQAAEIAKARLRRLKYFDSVHITFHSPPPELMRATNVIGEVNETRRPRIANFKKFSTPQAGSWSLGGSLKVKNLFGYGDRLDGYLVYGGNEMLSAGVSFPTYKGLLACIMGHAFLISQDWLKFSSYKKRSLGLSLDLHSSEIHHLAYSLSCLALTDPSKMLSRSVRRQLRHGLRSVLKYTFNIDTRDSPVRPTSGYAFVSTSHIGGLVPESRSLRFLRQEFDFRFAFPLGFFCGALNFGIAGGVLIPWGSEFLTSPASLPEKFILGGKSSSVCTLGGLASILGFKSVGLVSTEPRREVTTNVESSDNSYGKNRLRCDLAATAFADLSFDLPLRVFKEVGIYGHTFACAGSLAKLTENAFQDMSFHKFCDSLRSSIGCGIIIPSKRFRIEVNYCYIMKQHAHDRAKTGWQFNFSF